MVQSDRQESSAEQKIFSLENEKTSINSLLKVYEEERKQYKEKESSQKELQSQLDELQMLWTNKKKCTKKIRKRFIQNTSRL